MLTHLLRSCATWIATGVFTTCFFASIALAEDGPPGLQPEKIDIPGIVTNATGEPIANAQVDFIERSADVSGHFTAATSLAKATTDSTGRFVMKGVTINRYRINYAVRATAEGYAYHSIGLGLNGGQSFFDFWRQQQLDQAWIVLVPAQRLAGTVVDETGAPIAGAQVSDGDESYLPITTSADGKFAFDRTPVANAGVMHVDRHLFITHPDYVSVELRDHTNHPIVPGEQTVTLTHGIRISGQVTASDTHKPLEHMSVSAEVPHSHGVTYDASTDANGLYAIRVPRPRPTALPVGPRGRQPVERQEVILHFDGRDLFLPPAMPNGDYVPAHKDQQRYLDVTNAGDEVQNVDAQYEPNLVLRGTIQMADGSPVPESTQIQAIPEKGSNASGSGGRFATSLPSAD